jgi:beta-lactamase class A
MNLRPRTHPLRARRQGSLLLVAALAAGVVVGGCASPAHPLQAQAPAPAAVGNVAPVSGSLERLEREIERLAEIAGGTVGVGAIHLQTGRAVYLNGDEAFPMASSYKVPIAVELLRRVDAGELSLDSMYVLGPGDVSPGSGTLGALYQHPGVSLSLRNLTELMLLISDNSATDVVLRAAGGPAAVTERMRAVGVPRIRVDRSTTGLIADFLGMRNLPPEQDLTVERFGQLMREVSADERSAAARAFDSDARDTATPRAMARLLERIWRHEILSPESSILLLDIMRRSTTGGDRIIGMLPPGIAVAHKTGTIGGTTNDVGIITLPDGAGDVVTVLFVKGSQLEIPVRERAIAQISRSIYDYFLFNPDGD